ncbi:hypothetical protein [Streptomyces sp. DH10]|uniref:hypothetical protein n=1 Tax=Streptomyces sp. DH10 TaxID=3040121 RepID=UPI00244140E8|nr:hypothetical protein [Streptomyces sp. DH10]MDG9711146.1 hypothetical protein [Streptomyces sp. DH10]
MNLSADECRQALDAITGRLVAFGATGQFWLGRSEFTLSITGVDRPARAAGIAEGEVRAAFVAAWFGSRVWHIVRVDVWERGEWLAEQGLSEDQDEAE